MVTKEKFLEVCNRHKPNLWTRLVYRYFSKETKPSDKYVSTIVLIFFLTSFIVGYIGTVLKMPKNIILVATLVYSIALALLVLFMAIGGLMNYIRIKNIMKELGVSKEEYEKLCGLYL